VMGGFPAPMPAPPPQDPNVRLRVEKMAEYIVRNGPQFEEMMRQKQQGNSGFAFLFGGEHSGFYLWSVYALRRGWSKEMAEQQAALFFQQQNATAAAAAPQQGAAPFGAEDKAAFDNIMQELNRSKDSIRTTKEWILARCAYSDAITSTLRKTCEDESSPERRLNILYLVSDVLFNVIKRTGPDKDLMSSALARDLVFILRAAYKAQPSDQQNQALKVVSMWGQRQILDEGFVKTLQEGMTSDKAPPEPAAPAPAAAPAAAAAVPGGMPQMAGGMLMPGAPMAMQQAALLAMQQQAQAQAQALSMQVQQQQAAAAAQQQQAQAQAAALQQQQAQLPVGILIQCLKQERNRPYTPLDPSKLPTALPQKRPPSVDLLNQLQRFYDMDREDEHSARAGQSDVRQERDRSPARRAEFGPPAGRSNQFAPPQQKAEFAPPGDNSGRPGLGSTTSTEKADPFAAFRNRQSKVSNDRLAEYATSGGATRPFVNDEVGRD